MQISMFGQLSGLGDGSPIDATVEFLTLVRDEGFGRVWMSQLPYEPDLLTVLAVALHAVSPETLTVACVHMRDRENASLTKHARAHASVNVRARMYCMGGMLLERYPCLATRK